MQIKLTRLHLKICGIILAIVIVTPVLIVLSNRSSIKSSKQNLVDELELTSCLPAFRDGGGPYYRSGSPFREKIVPELNNGDRLFVEGRVLNIDCTKIVPNAVIDIWQANESGEYADEWYRGQIRTDEDGKYKFESIIPKGYGEGTGYRPPHIHFKVFVDGREIVTSQMFFNDVKGKEGFREEYIIKLEEKDDGLYGEHNIILPDYN